MEEVIVEYQTAFLDLASPGLYYKQISKEAKVCSSEIKVGVLPFALLAPLIILNHTIS